MNLIIDAGNTRVKFYEVRDNTISEPNIYNYSNKDDISNYILKTQFNSAIISSVGEFDKNWENIVSQKAILFIKLTNNTPIPIKNNYATPETLGYDRLAAAVGAAAIFTSKNILVIDLGTAITYDIVSKNIFLGGAIAPGMSLRFKSLHDHTSKLPLLEATTEYSTPGRTTNDSILNGVISGIKNEIEGTIKSYEKEYSELITVITGGDMDFFAKIIKNGIFAEPKLIAKGLNNILNYNVEKS
jgi:type III pantothenate kinase